MRHGVRRSRTLSFIALICDLLSIGILIVAVNGIIPRSAALTAMVPCVASIAIKLHVFGDNP